MLRLQVEQLQRFLLSISENMVLPVHHFKLLMIGTMRVW